MKAEDFSGWLSAIGGLSAAQIGEALAALAKAEAATRSERSGGSSEAAGKRRRREDALGATGVERVESQGCPHCAGREIVGWAGRMGCCAFAARAAAARSTP